MSRRFGKCKLIRVDIDPDMDAMYAQVMSTRLADVRSYGVWHVIAAWNRACHAALQSEALAETVGSIFTKAEHRTKGKANGGGRERLDHVVQSAFVRCAGLRGLGNEDGILKLALDSYFGGQGPDAWHFHTKRGTQTVLANQALRTTAPPEDGCLWRRSSLRDLVNSGEVALAKSLLPPGRGLFGLGADARRAAQSETEKREKTSEANRAAFAPAALPDSLWKSLGASLRALPLHMRPVVRDAALTERCR